MSLQESWTMVFMLAWWIFHLLSHIPRLMSFNITFVSIMTFHFSFSSWGLLYLCVLQHREITDCVLLLYSVLLTSDIVPCRRHRTGWDSEKKILGITLPIQLSYHDYGTELIQLTCHGLGMFGKKAALSPQDCLLDDSIALPVQTQFGFYELFA